MTDRPRAYGPASALEGIRVLDLSTVVAGPGAARYLADFGADVIKVERPGGDSTRSMGWKLADDADSLYWKLVNRGKRTISLDLKAPADRAVMVRLVDQADVLFENMRPGRLEKMGFAPDVLLERNPKLVILRITGFGQTGPYAQRPGFATIAEALSGYSALAGEPEGGPLLPPIALTDEVTALTAAFCAMVALRHAARTGEGQVVDVSLLESMLQIMGPLPSAWAHLGYLQPRLGSGLPFSVPRGTYLCADGTWVALSTSAESVARRVLRLIGLGDDARFASFEGRFEHRDEVEAHTKRWMGERSSGEVIAAFESVDAAIAPVYTMADIFADPHFRAREALIEVDGVVMQNVVGRLSRTPGRVRSVGPGLQDGADPYTIRFLAPGESPDRSLDGSTAVWP
jgi:crotonobetainyl-CoA:carnitine CoA-transferase CaiB-like acyl-CoA transferase